MVKLLLELYGTRGVGKIGGTLERGWNIFM